jgi:peptidyl-prolyl cis-trans isomerase C
MKQIVSLIENVSRAWFMSRAFVLFFSAFLFLSSAPLDFVVLPSFAVEQQKVVARVNNRTITEAELERAIDTYIPPGTYHGNIGSRKRDEYRKPALDLLIENELLYQEAAARGMEIGKEEVNAIVEETKKRYADKNSFERALKAAGITLDEFREILRKNELIKKMLKVTVADKSRYSDKDLEAYFDANKEKFIRPEGFRIRHILVALPPSAGDTEKEQIKKKAGDILARARSGQDFAGLAYAYSEDAYRIKGGNLGFVHKGRLEPVVEETALKLAVGEVGLAESGYGYHIIKLEEKEPAEQLSFSDVKDSLRKELESKRYKETKEALLKALREKATIIIY